MARSAENNSAIVTFLTLCRKIVTTNRFRGAHRFHRLVEFSWNIYICAIFVRTKIDFMENFWKTVYLLYLQQFWIFIFKLRFLTIGLVDRSFHYLLFELYRAIPRDTNITHNSSKNSTILSSNISLIITNVIFQTFHCCWKNSSKFLSFLFVNNHSIQFSPFVYITSDITSSNLSARRLSIEIAWEKKNNRFVSPFTHPLSFHG